MNMNICNLTTWTGLGNKQGNKVTNDRSTTTTTTTRSRSDLSFGY